MTVFPITTCLTRHVQYRAVWCLLALTILSGCAHRAPQPVDDWSRHQATIQDLSHWSLSGKLGVRIPGENGSATLRWQQIETHYTLDLSGPFGQGRVLIDGKPGKVSLQRPGDAPLIADSAEELIEHAVGWTLPVAHLAYWVRGVPDPHQAITQIAQDELGLLATLEQAGWRLTYSQYDNVLQPGKPSVQLPGKIIAEYDDIRLTLIIRQWQTGK